ncbi:MAG: efflux RND transporter periplasmic adaptor subunit [Prevotellaceae bacterium]|jgi:HlyD family secretion protein|nr:efflux RND transporter periplasmic adaptor subunit [Prevotellaceae bacterium]
MNTNLLIIINRMNGISKYLSMLALACFASCGTKEFKYDASGTFEAVEVMISSEASGLLESFKVTEGQYLPKGEYLGYIDTVPLYLKKLQLLAAQRAVKSRKPDVATQISATREQIAKAELEKKRVENLFNDSVATQKQIDDATSQLNVLKKSLSAQINSLNTSVNSLDDESASVDIQIAQLDYQLSKCRIINPVDGTVLNKYAEEKELAVTGKPLYRIADMKNMFIRVFVISDQLERIRTGLPADVFVMRDGNEKVYHGAVSWISSRAEFTPKTVQTKDERQNLVYAVKIALENSDGLLKSGMYGDVRFSYEK